MAVEGFASLRRGLFRAALDHGERGGRTHRSYSDHSDFHNASYPGPHRVVGPPLPPSRRPGCSITFMSPSKTYPPHDDAGSPCRPRAHAAIATRTTARTGDIVANDGARVCARPLKIAARTYIMNTPA